MAMNRREFINASSATFLMSSCYGVSAQVIDTARIYVGFPAGSTPDILARKVGDKLVQGGYARSVIVENKVGAGGQLAVASVKATPPDGTHILLTAMAMLGVYPFTYKKLPYDPINDLTPVTIGASFDYGIAVGTMVPESVKDIAGLMAWFKANPDKASIASPAPGSPLHFTGVMLGRNAGVELTHIGYRGSPPALQDLLGGTLPALVSPLGSFLAYTSSGSKIRVLATSGGKRSRFTPNVPTLVEQGYKDMNFNEWYGFYLSAKAPTDVVRRLNGALHQALKGPDITDSLASFGMEPTPCTQEEQAAALQRDLKIWGPIVKSIGFTADS